MNLRKYYLVTASGDVRKELQIRPDQVSALNRELNNNERIYRKPPKKKP